ncbi:hypothetical protein [Thaumasiovibrio subtropicus]|uniref:hypothetical protein n=1 Tax=Thaumasiovibrio subtropicus TaxID=1891207 RepID=UPI000B352137|nr:hypothetical protein [Thaumasiovibrio subtropicus]
MNAIEAIQLLQTNPLTFLRRNSFTAFAAPTTAGAVHQFFMVDRNTDIERPGQILGNLNTHTGQKFQARANNNLGGGTGFNAAHIPVQPSNIAINPIALPLHGAGIMLTTQLTGCCMVVVPQGNTFGVAHLQPTGETGLQLCQRLRTAGMRVFGQSDYQGSRGIFVGARINGTWGFYTQLQDANFNVKSANRF